MGVGRMAACGSAAISGVIRPAISRFMLRDSAMVPPVRVTVLPRAAGVARISSSPTVSADGADEQSRLP